MFVRNSRSPERDRHYGPTITIQDEGDDSHRDLPPDPFELSDMELALHMSTCEIDNCITCHPPKIINVDDDDFELLSAEQVAAFRERSSSGTPAREVGLYTDRELRIFQCSGYTYKPGMSRVAEVMDENQDTFIGIASIIERTKGADRKVFIRGPLYKRTKAHECLNMLELKKNEVVRIKKSEMMSMERILRPRFIIFTNTLWPTFNHYCDGVHSDEAKLVCRWRISADVREGYVELLSPEEVTNPRLRRDSQELRVEWRGGTNLYSDSLTPTPPRSRSESASSRKVVCHAIRSSSAPATPSRNEPLSLASRPLGVGFGGFHTTPQTPRLLPQDSNDADVIITGSRVRNADAMMGDDGDLRQVKRKFSRMGLRDPSKDRYTFGDAFCGAGGMGSGARAAGLFNKWGFDHDRDAVNAYCINFPECDVYHHSVDTFLSEYTGGNQVDVLHLSPPCQPHSPAHTTPGCNDEANEAAGLCVDLCLKKLRPRVVTLEQTFGLTHRGNWFSAMIHQFTQNGFSIRWKVLQCAEYGVPQPRRRLIMLASCPGERLPDFPAPSHNMYKGNSYNVELHKPPTVGDALESIPHDDRDESHNTYAMEYERGKEKIPMAKWDEPLPRTILTRGDYDIHPFGFRRFTPRELACLQTFPVTHKFCGSASQQKKQIGNAVPPKFAQAVLTEVRKSLERTDREEAAGKGVVKEVVGVRAQERVQLEIVDGEDLPQLELIMVEHPLVTEQRNTRKMVRCSS